MKTHTAPPPLIEPVIRHLDLPDAAWTPYGRDKAKLEPALLNAPRARTAPPRLILVSAITPTPAGEGKTTTSIGLAQAMQSLGASVCLALREPSLGPCLGFKGGATGGGMSRLVPSDDINLHFTGDMHAVTAAHNLIAAALDNHLHHRLLPAIDARRVLWPRVVDMNDRALRHVIVGLGGRGEGVPRESGFDITAASEVMAMLCLADDMDDLRRRIDRTLVAFGPDGEPISVGDLGVTGAALALLRDALKPNLVQTVDGVPALVHGGPFANIAHGCSSVMATRMAMHLADWTITEAGFGFDLGAEKFFDIKCTSAGLDADAVVLVATVRALKMHGDVANAELGATDVDAVVRGLANLDKHVENIAAFDRPVVVAINRFGGDDDAEVAAIAEHCRRLGVRCAVAEHFARGAAGAVDLARAVMAAAAEPHGPLRPLYPADAGVIDKIVAVATRMYGAERLAITAAATRDLAEIERLGYGGLPVCIAKTQSSLSDDPHRRGRPMHFDVTVRRLLINAGAGFIVVLTGDVMRMPGLPRAPHALGIDVVDGVVVGVA